MQTFDFSRGASSMQSLFFAFWGVAQLVISSIAFQRSGFFYGLSILVLGIIAFCAAGYFVLRFNRQRLSIDQVGIALKQDSSS